MQGRAVCSIKFGDLIVKVRFEQKLGDEEVNQWMSGKEYSRHREEPQQKP